MACLLVVQVNASDEGAGPGAPARPENQMRPRARSALLGGHGLVPTHVGAEA